MYIWLLLKLFLGRVYEQEKKNVYTSAVVEFERFKKKNPNVSIMRS